jgi:biotin transport system substrate-specific component
MTSSTRPVGADLARIAVFAALIIVLGMVTIPMPGGVPITGQTLGVMLAGLVLGPRRAPLSILLVLALAAIGLPVLAGGRGGLGAFVGPTAGYLVGWIAGAFVIGLIARSGKFTWWRAALASVVGGIFVIYLFGVPVQSFVTGVPLGPTIISSLVFLPGDLVKAAVATVLAVALHRAYPRAFESRAVTVNAAA